MWPKNVITQILQSLYNIIYTLAPVDIQIQAGDETNGIENNENPSNMNQIESEKQSDMESSNLNLAEIQANSFLQSIQLPELEKQREAILSELGMYDFK